MRLGVIYKVSIKDKFLIGSSVDFKSRKNNYLKKLRKNRYENSYLQNVFNKYGEENLKFEIVQKDVPESILSYVESIWIGALCGRIEDKQFGMNMRDGHRLNLTRESILKMCIPIVQRDKEGNFIKRWESTADVYKEHPEYRGRVIYQVLKNKRRSAYGFQWHYESEDNDFKMRPSKQCYKVIQTDLEGNFIREWESTAHPEEEGFFQVSVWRCCSGQRTQHKGYKWKFA